MPEAPWPAASADPGAADPWIDRVPAPRSQPADEPGLDLADRYRLLVDLIPDGVVVHQDGRIVYANASALRLVGGQADQVLGREIFSFILPGARAELGARLASMVEPGVPSTPAETTLLRVDGGTTVVESISVQTLWEGRPALQAILRDLTERRAAQAALRYRAALVEHVSDAIIATDNTGRVTSWNPAAEAMFLLAPAGALGRDLTDLLGVALDPAQLAATPRVQMDFRRPDGRVLAIRTTATPLSAGDGYVLLCSDETASREAEQRFSAVVFALEEGVVAVDATGIVQSVNPAAERLLGLLPHQRTGLRAEDLPLLDELGRPLAGDNPLEATRRTGVPQQSQSIAVDRPDGSRVWLTAHSRPLAQLDPPCAAVVSLTDVTERRATAQRLRHAATHDSLTGLANRALLLDKIVDACSRVATGSGVLALLFVDLDNFKTINDTGGHEAGDAALRTVAKRISARARTGDVVARIGGDEFVVMAELPGADDAEPLAGRILEGLARPAPGRLRPHLLQASIGIVTTDMVDDPRTPDELLRDADAAMYQAKARGGNHAAAFDAELQADHQRRRLLEADLRLALSGSGLWVAYQPLVELATGRWIGAEALSRWSHPTLGSINPLEFVTIAEQSPLIHQLGRRALATACRDAVTLRSSGLATFSMSVNLSPRQLEDPQLAERVHEVLEASTLPASALCLEVTESSLALDELRAERTLETFRSLGIRIAIDDFGTGYSSLARLRTLPVDELKIDRSFITSLPTDRQARHVVASIITLAHALDMQVVAEGVETPEHARILAELDCDIAQGYHYSRPVPLSAFRVPK